MKRHEDFHFKVKTNFGYIPAEIAACYEDESNDLVIEFNQKSESSTPIYSSRIFNNLLRFSTPIYSCRLSNSLLNHLQKEFKSQYKLYLTKNCNNPYHKVIKDVENIQLSFIDLNGDYASIRIDSCETTFAIQVLCTVSVNKICYRNNLWGILLDYWPNLTSQLII